MKITLLWPEFLILLAWLPVLAAGYVWFQRRKRRAALRYSSVALIRPAIVRRLSWRRHVPPALFMMALASLIVTMARPTGYFTSRSRQTTVILAIDVSGSMTNEDILPNRLAAAEAAAVSFIEHQKPNTRIGVVQFSRGAELVIPPSTDHEKLRIAIHSLTTGVDTAIGSGIFTALETISNDSKAKLGKEAVEKRQALPKGVYAPEAIILLTDGVSNYGPPPLNAARAAAERRIRVYTIGFGTQTGMAQTNGASNGSSFFNWGVDEPALIQIAAITGGRYYTARNASELEKIFENLSTSLYVQTHQQEISTLFAALGALLAAISIIGSLLWHPLP